MVDVATTLLKVPVKSYLLVDVELPEDLGRVEQVVLLEDPRSSQYSSS
jgi:hypothetical protein